MKKAFLVPFIICLLLILCLPLSSGIHQFEGRWKNINPNTQGVTTLEIQYKFNRITVKAWRKCHPTDCFWGQARAIPYTRSLSADMIRDASRLLVSFDASHFHVNMIIYPFSGNQLRAEVMARVIDGSGNSNYWEIHTFRKVPHAVPAPPMPTVLREDCVSFNPMNARVRNIGGRWQIVDGSHQLFDFGHKRGEAGLALRIIKHYGMNQSCFVGRPHPSFQYLLVSGRAPAGPFPGEDCIEFNPQTASVRNINGRWKIVDGSQWLFDFGNKELEARKSLRIIKKYRFRFTCFVGRPNASFKYLRR